MAENINLEELKAMVANQIKNDGLNEVLNNINIEEIAKNILFKSQKEQAQNAIPDIIPEQVEGGSLTTSDSGMPTEINKEEEPSAKYYTPSTNLNDFGTGTTNSPDQIDQSTSGNIPAYTPELPSFMNKIDPGKVIVFDMNELSQGGENLSHTPFRTFENPDVKKSMNDLWTEDGKRKVEVYVSKFEKVGEIEFNYANGTSQFIEKRFEPDFTAQAKYKENPYMAGNIPEATPVDPNKNALIAQIGTAVDLEGMVKNILMDLIKKGVSNTTLNLNGGQNQAGNPIEESTPGYAAYKMFKGDGDIKELNDVAKDVFKLDMSRLVDDNGEFSKTDLPSELKEYIDSGRRECLTNENQEVEEWSFNGLNYYLPKNRISKNKGYIKK